MIKNHIIFIILDFQVINLNFINLKGFLNKEKNLKLLKEHDGDLEKIINNYLI